MYPSEASTMHLEPPKRGSADPRLVQTEPGRVVIVDMSKTTQWRHQVDKKYIPVTQRYGVARYIAEGIGSSGSYWVMAFYSSDSNAYITTLPLPVDVWKPTIAPDPFHGEEILYLGFANYNQLYDLGRPFSNEFVHKPADALKRAKELVALDRADAERLIVIAIGK